MTRRLWSFPGGLKLAGHKADSTGKPLRKILPPAQLILPLQQHIGEPAKPVVEVGERVLKGQVIARAEGYVSVPIHASSSGVVKAIEERPVPHPSGLAAPCIVIETDGRDEWLERKPHTNYKELDPSQLRNIIRDAGVVGLGGAGFPSFIKLNPGGRTAIDTLILNGAECEPYITCDDMLMRERPDEVIAGVCIMRHALHPRHTVIGIEDNKPEAYAALKAEVEKRGLKDIEVVRVPTRYPAGGEKQLIKVLTGKEVPSGGLPLDIGVVCHNVATAASVHRAVELGEPLIERIVTVTGPGINEPCNLEAPIGTPVERLLAEAGGFNDKAVRLLLGGPMMGFTLDSTGYSGDPAAALPLVRTGNCLLALEEQPAPGPIRACIRCGECARVCPSLLLPQQLYWYARAKEFDKVQDYKLFDCIECGCCDYVCPSNLPLVQYYRYAKTEIWAQERERKASELARRRHDFRTERQEREKAERAAKLAKKKAALKASEAKKAGGEEAKKAAIQAAVERAKAKRESSEITPKNVDALTEAQKKQIAEADARRAGKKKQADAPAESGTEE